MGMETMTSTLDATTSARQNRGSDTPAQVWTDGAELTDAEPLTGVEFYLRNHTAGTASAGKVVVRWDGTRVLQSASGAVWQVADVEKFRVATSAERNREFEELFLARTSRADRIRLGYECLGCGAVLPGGLAAGWPRQRCSGCRK